MRQLGQRKGAVLIIVLGVLAILALLATTFATLQATERQVSHNYLDTVRAKLLAQSGLQDAEGKLREYFPYRYFNTLDIKAPKPWKYWGADRVTNPWETKEPMPDDKIEEATNPSFAVEADAKNIAENPQDPTDTNYVPKAVTIEGQRRGLSGFQGGTYATHGDQYVLKITDASGRLYVNDGVDGTPQSKRNSVSRNLCRILNVLGDVIGSTKLGDKIVDNRPQEGYRSMQDVLKALNYDEALFNRLKNYITVYAWVDNNVVNPVPLSEKIALQTEGLTGVKYDRGTSRVYRAGSRIQGVDFRGAPLLYGLDYIQNGGGGGGAASDLTRPEVKVFGHDALIPQYIEVVSRAPVNVNAATEEVLISLVTGLQGFFLTDRRRNNPRWEGDLYLAFKMQYRYSPERTSKGDEVGYLINTFPIVNTTGTVTQGISAKLLAQEIIACRNGEKSKFDTRINYDPKAAGGQWFGGPFRSWHQFNAFVDFMARSKIEGGLQFLEDKRMDVYKDYEEAGVDPIGFGALVPSEVQRAYGSQAIADVIKANFNPNCHLNELNPDQNLFLIVDKTDLFCNSTEFCFMPTGYFEVESLGRILRPKTQGVTDAYTGDNDIAAQAKVTAIFRLYDMYRESTQKQFYGGTLAPQSSTWGTNNDKSVEIGPEPDNGVFPGNLAMAGKEPADNEWDGYISLPTMGGVFGGGHGAAPKQPNSLVRTQSLGKSPHQSSVMHTHFTLDHDLHDHPTDTTEIGCKKPVPIISETYNHPDYVEGMGLMPTGGPYNPTKGIQGFHRLSKSFRIDANPSGGASMAGVNLTPYAPSDLRIDGAYVERHAAPVYFNSKGGIGVWNFGAGASAAGMMSFWWKPAFSPERTGKIRTLFDISRHHDICGADVNVWPFSIWFYPAHYNPGVSEVTHPEYWHNNMGKFNPASIVGGSKQWHENKRDANGNVTWYPQCHEFGRMTVCLNHLDHDDHKYLKPSPLQAHRWINTTFSWNAVDNAGEMNSSKIFLNGTEFYTKYDYHQMTTFNSGHGTIGMFDKHDASGPNPAAFNHIRLGGASQTCEAARVYAGLDPGMNNQGAYRGNYTGDQTIDEYYAWNTPSTNGTILWDNGRYYKPTSAGGTAGGVSSQGRFTSQVLTNMVPYTPRLLAPASATPAPGGGGASGGTMVADPPTLRILGMSWTWYGEQVDPRATPLANWDGTRVLYDCSVSRPGDEGVPTKGGTLNPKVGAGIDDAGTIYGPYYNDAFSAIMNTKGRTPSIQDTTKLKYFVQIEVQVGGKPVLLASPVIDDVTLYWDDNQSHMLSYVFDNRSF